MVRSFPGISAVNDVENGLKALEYLDNNPVDIMLLDLDMPVMDGWETSRIVVERYPSVHIIMVSMYDSLSFISDLIEIGVHSYLLKTSEPEEVQRAIESVMNNDFYYNQIVARALLHKLKKSEETIIIDKHIELTPREVEILELICQELSMREIGDRLFLSEQTVHTHRKNLMRKTNCRNAVGLVKFAIQHKVVQI